MDDLDHLHEARQHVKATPIYAKDHYLRSQAHALIAIAERLDLLIEAQKPIRHMINEPLS